MKTHLITGLKITVATIILFGAIYPLMITGIARVIAPNGGRGEEVKKNGRVVGFELIGQKFDDDKYFNGRPSVVDYNAAGTGGSNKGPTNPDYLAQVQARVDTFLVHNPAIKKSQIPVDLITASGGGLDPHISPAAARIQIQRIAGVRHLDVAKLEALVEAHVEKPILGMGTSRVHVLHLNIALDELK
ncbi:K(+)-transporting ATPase subunit C [Chryseolinea lacunae]|uniref:Potassium-transporting ATPase KdpC subunit n=1 Tax=Chryseolinea lacunae TaxID=2801331 RepID=A0ABS1KMV7_9BACT|nr:K(+)-transporting ATPase subunit C [Chryseolinea lacunae]MBL0740002.1 K(+)-transporting ATPase subunit C [Chryseolinea lacunae]